MDFSLERPIQRRVGAIGVGAQWWKTLPLSRNGVATGMPAITQRLPGR